MWRRSRSGCVRARLAPGARGRGGSGPGRAAGRSRRRLIHPRWRRRSRWARASSTDSSWAGVSIVASVGVDRGGAARISADEPRRRHGGGRRTRPAPRPAAPRKPSSSHAGPPCSTSSWSTAAAAHCRGTPRRRCSAVGRGEGELGRRSAGPGRASAAASRAGGAGGDGCRPTWRPAARAPTAAPGAPTDSPSSTSAGCPVTASPAWVDRHRARDRAEHPAVAPLHLVDRRGRGQRLPHPLGQAAAQRRRGPCSTPAAGRPSSTAR